MGNEVDLSVGDLVPGFAEALQKLDAIREMLAEANSHLVSVAREFLLSAETDEDRISRAEQVYWNCPEMPVAEIANCVLGTPDHVARLVKLFPAKTSPVMCGSCGQNIPVKSRSALRELTKNQRFGPPVCAACQAEKRAANQIEWRATEKRRLARHCQLQAMAYRDYLLTEEWLEIRNQKLKQARFRCQLCNSNGLLNVHHRTYDRPRGQGYMSDLTVLCRNCHGKFHDKLPEPVVPSHAKREVPSIPR